MIHIPIRVAGDVWANPRETQESLNCADPAQIWQLDLGAEGPSLTALGVVDAVVQRCRELNKPLDSVLVSGWFNFQDQIPFSRDYSSPRPISHFFWRSEEYSDAHYEPGPEMKKFALFVGRRTFARCRMIHDVWHEFRDQALLSLMQTAQKLPWHDNMPAINLETYRDWVQDHERDGFESWWSQCPVGSIDDYDVMDQYVDQPRTNWNIIQHYGRFHIEIVAETYTIGPCFFTTEKTIRPVVAKKPMLIYGPQNYLANLRDLGFQTWNDHWDESYDSFEGPERWYRIKRIMRDINIADLNPSITEHNKCRLAELIKEHSPTKPFLYDSKNH